MEEFANPKTEPFRTRDGREIILNAAQQALFLSFRENMDEDQALAMAVAGPKSASRDRHMEDFTADLARDLKMRAGIDAEDATAGKVYSRRSNSNVWETEVRGKIMVNTSDGATYRLTVERVL